MFGVMLTLLIAGASVPDVSWKNDARYQTLEACKADLPRFHEEFIANAKTKGFELDKNYQFFLQCKPLPDDGSI